MACYKPIQAWHSKEINDNGKREMVFTHLQAHEPDKPINLPCGQCVGCRIQRSREWAMRCVHEAEMYEDNCFITLTFDNEHLMKRDFPESLDVRDYQLFMKRLRKKYGSDIRFFHCGEYGDRYGRPHYHAILFNLDFPDKQLWKITPTGERLYISPSLQKLWPYGFSTIGSVTYQSAAYVARYVMKKITGKQALEHYAVGHDPETGEIITKKPEYTTMSRRPGIGKQWLDKFIDDVYPNDFVVFNGKKVRPPRFYDKILDTLDPTEQRDYELSIIQDARKEKAYQYQENNTPERLEVREKLQLIRADRLIRPIDMEN